MARFEVGKIYKDASGSDVRIICTDSGIRNLPIVGIWQNAKAGAINQVRQYDNEGIYCGIKGNATYAPHSLVSDEPSDEELELIRTMVNLTENWSTERSRDADLLKVIRQLRKK